MQLQFSVLFGGMIDHDKAADDRIVKPQQPTQYAGTVH